MYPKDIAPFTSKKPWENKVSLAWNHFSQLLYGSQALTTHAFCNLCFEKKGKKYVFAATCSSVQSHLQSMHQKEWEKLPRTTYSKTADQQSARTKLVKWATSNNIPLNAFDEGFSDFISEYDPKFTVNHFLILKKKLNYKLILFF